MSSQIINNKNTEPRSEYISDIVARPPSLLVRVGAGIIFLCVALAILISLFIEYPDVIEVKSTIESENPAIYLSAKASGRIEQIYIDKNGYIMKNEVLCIIESPERYNDVLAVSRIVEKIQNDENLADSLYFINIGDFELGEMTLDFLNLSNSVNDYKLYLLSNSKQREIVALRIKLENYEKILTIQSKQSKIQFQELELIRQNYERSLKLFDNGAISKLDYENKNKEYLNAQKNYESNAISIANTELDITEISKELTNLEIESNSTILKFESEIRNHANLLSIRIAEWKNRYLITSPINGKIESVNIWKINQTVHLDDRMFLVTPQEFESHFATLIVPISKIGEVKNDQSVLIEVEGYPEYEFGLILGYISYISEVPNEDGYTVLVRLPNNLLTNTGQQIPKRTILFGKAKILLKHQKVFFKIMHKVFNY